MRLKQSEARDVINKIKENLKIEIESFFDVADCFPLEIRILHFEELKHRYQNNTIDSFFTDNSIKQRINLNLKSSYHEYIDTLNRIKENTTIAQKPKDELLERIETIFQFNDLYQNNIEKFVLLCLIDRFETMEYLSYSLSDYNSLSFFKRQFSIEELYANDKSCLDIGHKNFILSKNYLENFIDYYEEFKLKHENNLYKKNVVLETILNHAKDAILISSFMEQYT